MNTTDFDTLPKLAELLAADGWVIYEYKVIGSDGVTLTIVRKENGEKSLKREEVT